ncbi:cation:proton antiporter [Euzebya tangerina]|uniref:cation:proton antiporter n=1 Tax=Euzebya tangerina TaxID=591198 RepID=UPI000E321D16|nr:cation:proton antiporter [Euzebya tangerina]
MILAAAAGEGAAQAALIYLELGAVFVGLALLARLAHRLSISPIPFYLLAGLAFGEGGLAPLDLSEEFTALGAEIGVLLLLFMLGLEYTPAELGRSVRTQALAGLVDLVANGLPGVALALILGWGWPAAVLLGGVTYISSSGVISKVLSDLGRMGNRETPVVLGLLVIEDLVMALYLPIVAVVFLGGSGGMTSLAIAAGVLAIVLVLLLRFDTALSSAVGTGSSEALLLMVFGLVLVVSGLAQQIEISSAVGAFLVGIALSGEVAERAREQLTPLRDIFAATFFLFFALGVDPADIPAVALPAIGLAVVTALTKYATGWWAAGRAGIAGPGRIRAGATLIARGEFSIVIAGLAVSGGIEPEIGPLAATYVLLLAVGGSVLARFADDLRRWATTRSAATT